MNVLALPWLDVSILVALIGAIWVSRQRDPISAYRSGLILTGIAFFCTFMAWLAYRLGTPVSEYMRWSIQTPLFGRQVGLVAVVVVLKHHRRHLRPDGCQHLARDG